jgi:hypothetical protein
VEKLIRDIIVCEGAGNNIGSRTTFDRNLKLSACVDSNVVTNGKLETQEYSSTDGCAELLRTIKHARNARAQLAESMLSNALILRPL